MTISLTSPVTGGAQTGFTSPTYTIASDTSVANARTKQWAVTALGGTQAGVRTSTGSDPFWISYTPPVVKSLPAINSQTGRYGNIPFNVHQFNARKGVNFAANQSPLPAWAELRIGIPAGGEYDAANIRALCSLLIGALNQLSAGCGDTLVTSIP
jgi:hypothetical protein